MDLGTIRKNFKQEKYKTIESMFDDIQLVWDNAKAYNPENSVIMMAFSGFIQLP